MINNPNKNSPGNDENLRIDGTDIEKLSIVNDHANFGIGLIDLQVCNEQKAKLQSATPADKMDPLEAESLILESEMDKRKREFLEAVKVSQVEGISIGGTDKVDSRPRSSMRREKSTNNLDSQERNENYQVGLHHEAVKLNEIKNPGDDMHDYSISNPYDLFT